MHSHEVPSWKRVNRETDPRRHGCNFRTICPIVYNCKSEQLSSNVVIGDRRLKIREIAETLRISYDRIQNIVNELVFLKIFARCFPRLLSIEQKRNRLTIPRNCLELFKADPQEFLDRFVTMNKTSVHNYTPKSKHSKQWKRVGPPPLKKAVIVLSADKGMTSVFGDSEGDASPCIFS